MFMADLTTSSLLTKCRISLPLTVSAICQKVYITTFTFRLDKKLKRSTEMPNPSRNIPRAMIATLVIGCVTDFIVCICLMFSVGTNISGFFDRLDQHVIYLNDIQSLFGIVVLHTLRLCSHPPDRKQRQLVFQQCS